MRITMIHNPSAGDETHSATRLTEMLADAGHEVHLRSTDRSWKKALDREADLIVVAGGDGTVGKVAVRLAHRGVPLAILPTGTANNIGKTLGVMGDVREIIASWSGSEQRPFDLGIATAPWGEDRFVESMGGGVLAEVIAPVTGRGSRSIVGRESDRALFRLRELLERSEPERWSIDVDGSDRSGEYLGVEILNVRFVGPNIALAPDADPGDGQLDVVLIADDDRHGLLEYAASRMEDAAGDLPSLPVHQGRRIRLEPPPRTRLHLDDDAWPGDSGKRKGGRSIDVRVEAGAVRVVA